MEEWIPSSPHTCMHACMHTYVHTYVPTYIYICYTSACHPFIHALQTTAKFRVFALVMPGPAASGSSDVHQPSPGLLSELP